ncbi:MAG TPA: OmpH family outer membrane protein [Sphingomicrobium sp.]
MRKILLLSALVASTAIPAAVHAQAKGGIIVVDTDQILKTCTACVSAQSQLQQKETTLRTRAQTLNTQLTNEGKPIQAAVDALKGKDPDAALQQKITAFETKQRNAQQELATSQRQLQSTAANVQQQIAGRLVQIVEQIRARRGAALAVAKDATLANDSAGDVTSEVLAALNSALPSVSVTPLPQSQQQPQGR